MIKCLLATVDPSSAIKQFKDNTITYSIQTLCIVFHLCMALF